MEQVRNVFWYLKFIYRTRDQVVRFTSLSFEDFLPNSWLGEMNVESVKILNIRLDKLRTGFSRNKHQ